MGLKLLSDHKNASNTVTAILAPEGIDTKTLLKKLREEDSVVFATGQDHMKGKMFRIGHLGFFSEADLAQAMDALSSMATIAGARLLRNFVRIAA